MTGDQLQAGTWSSAVVALAELLPIRAHSLWLWHLRSGSALHMPGAEKSR